MALFVIMSTKNTSVSSFDFLFTSYAPITQHSHSLKQKKMGKIILCAVFKVIVGEYYLKLIIIRIIKIFMYQ